MSIIATEDIRIVGISGSPRHANTELLVNKALDTVRDEYGFSTTLVSLAGKKISGCLDCRGCRRKKTYCVIKDDWLDLVKPLIDPVPDGVIIGAPVYFVSVNSQLRAYMERCTSLLRARWDADFPHPPPDWSKTAGSAIAVGYDRHGGQEHAITSIINWFLVTGFAVVAGYYTGGPAWQHEVDETDSVAQDELGMANAVATGRVVAETALRLKLGAEAARDFRRKGT